MWENPYYYFRIPYTDSLGKEKYREIIIDVTLSAWSKEISPDYKNVLNSIIGISSTYSIESVLDFGCGKLNSVNYILNKNKHITIVDFKEILDKYKVLNDILKNLKNNPKFKKMEFPNPFINDQSEYDLGLIANVLPFMPVFLERLYVLQILHQKIKQDKFLLWYAMKKPTKYRKREMYNKYIMGDGIWLREDTAKYKTFYNYHPIDYLTLLMYLSGFHLERIFRVPSVDSVLFKRTKYNLFKDIFSKDLLNNSLKYQMIDKDKLITKKSEIEGEITPYPEIYDIYHLIQMYLDNIKPGRTNLGYPDKFKRITAGILQYLFFNQLTNMIIEDPIDDGKGFIDITFQTTNKSGFFTELQEKYKVLCPIIFIECKNKATKLTNTEYSQLYDRFDEYRGKFGILVCRDKVDEKEVLTHLKPRIKKGYYVIVLDDNDLLNLLKLKFESGEEVINEFFEKKIKELLM